MKILWNFEKSLKTIKVRNFSKDMQRIKDFCQNIKEKCAIQKVCIVTNYLMILASIKIWDVNMFSQFSSKECAHFLLIFLQNFFYKRGFFPKNLWNLWPKIFKASEIL